MLPLITADAEVDQELIAPRIGASIIRSFIVELPPNQRLRWKGPKTMAVGHPLLFDGSMLLVAGSCLYTAIEGVRSGEIFIAIGVHVKRAEDAPMFWFGIVGWLVGAIAFVWAMFLAQR